MMNKMDESLAMGSPLSGATWDDFVERLRHNCLGEGVKRHCAADALFIVEKKVFRPVPDGWSDNLAILDEGSWCFDPDELYEYADADEVFLLNSMASAYWGADGFSSLSTADKFDLIARFDKSVEVFPFEEAWEYVSCHFTREAAEAFIERKQHDYPDGLRVWVDSQHLCWEFNAIKNAILYGYIIFNPAARRAHDKE